MFIGNVYLIGNFHIVNGEVLELIDFDDDHFFHYPCQTFFVQEMPFVNSNCAAPDRILVHAQRNDFLHLLR